MRFLMTLVAALGVLGPAGPAFGESNLPQLPALELIDADATSGEPERIKAAIEAYRQLDQDDPEVQWRLVRAYFGVYDELFERGPRSVQQWAADNGYELAKKAYAAHPDHAEIVYYYATIGLCYLDFHRLKALFLIGDLFDAFKKAQQLKPEIDDGGPDRSLGVLYYELPGWPLGRGDKEKALAHIEAAVKIEPRRAANRISFAKLLAEFKRYDEGWKHIEFVRAGDFKVSSPYWHSIYMKRVEEVAAEFPQSHPTK